MEVPLGLLRRQSLDTSRLYQVLPSLQTRYICRGILFHDSELKISSTESTMNNLQNSVRMQSDAVMSLANKISDSRNAELENATGVS